MITSTYATPRYYSMLQSEREEYNGKRKELLDVSEGSASVGSEFPENGGKEIEMR